MAFDSRTGEIVMFGGLTTTGHIDTSIWVYNYSTNTWANKNPLPHPSAGIRAAIVYDSESDRFVLFGGSSATERTNKTWVYDLNGNAWTLMHPSLSPTARNWHAMAYDASADRVILFGGYHTDFYGNAAGNDETWTYDLNTNSWTNMNPSSKPAGRFGHAISYDSAARRTILQGGIAGQVVTAETWAYDFASNSWTQLAAGPSRVDHALAYDARSDRILLFGGDGSGGGDTWSFDYGSNAWTDMAPSASPPHTSGIPWVYDAIADRTVLFPDFYDPTPSYDPSDDVRGALWAYDFESNAWSPRLPPPHPGVRSSFGFAYDDQSSQAVLFGGNVLGSPSGETWAYSPASMGWAHLSSAVAPSARGHVAMVYASRHDRIVLFGGSAGSLGESDETWLFDFDQNVWSNPNPSLKPPARHGHGLAYDPAADRVVLFGGVRSLLPYVHLNDTWTYDIGNNTWSNVTPAFSPAAREAHMMAYAARSDKVVLFGGFNLEFSKVIGNETWIYDVPANSWTRAEPAFRPTPRWFSSMAYDAMADRVILFGGVHPGGTCCAFYDDTWSYDVANDTWVRLEVGDHPGGVYGHRVVYDSQARRVLMYGGAFDDSTWSYAYASPVPPGPVAWDEPRTYPSSVSLSWLAPADTGGAAIVGYRVYRGTSPEGATYLATTSAPSYRDGRVDWGVRYYYYVRAVNAAGEGDPSEAFVVLIGGEGADRARLLLIIGPPSATVGTILAIVYLANQRRRRPPKAASLNRTQPR